ncbi:MAG: dTDP-4-dehydrorhamnose 3,5-epimerase [Bacteroidota bacterium]|nr:dTDP-4-dehydrorhamnose 3,5-epimerase [Bacteroidota bacterium]
MKVTTMPIEGVLIIEPSIFSDERGYFFESYNEPLFHKAGISARFVQDNQSQSAKGVLRGLHFQNPPFEQGKLVRVVKGGVIDVAVDIRKASPTYGNYVAVNLSADNQKMMWIPPGFAHGFVTLEDDTLFLYKCTNVYNKASEGGIIWNDPSLHIDWGFENPVVSSKDLELRSFENLISVF